MPPQKHALLGASSASRWLACPPSARLTESMQDKGSSFAAEGSIAHELAELKVKSYFTPTAKSAFTRKHNRIKKEEYYSAEMESVTDAYLDYIKDCAMAYDSPPYVAIEESVDYSGYVPEGFGTADCIMIGGSTMRVIDFKYGKGVPVSVRENPQMMLYAIGALSRYQLIYLVDTVILSIAQLRLEDEPQEWETTPEELFKWAAEFVAPRAKLAYSGEGDFQDGEHCRFCKARATCRKRAQSQLGLTKLHSARQNPALLSEEEIGVVLSLASPYKRWLEHVEGYALESVLAGKKIPGWKAVEGRSIRRFDDIDNAFADLKEAGIDESLLYERKPVSLTEIEKALGKKEFAEKCGTHVIKPPGKPTLVPESDKREPINSAAKDFGGIQTA